MKVLEEVPEAAVEAEDVALPREAYPQATLTIQMPEGMLRRLQESAAAQGKPVEELAFELLEDHVLDIIDGQEIARLRADPTTEWVPWEQVKAEQGL